MAELTPAPRYEVLNVHSHRQLKVLGHQGYDFARGLRSADLVVSEFEPAASLYPLVFVREADGLYRPVALLKRSGGGHGYASADGSPLCPEIVVSSKARLRSTIATTLRIFGAATALMGTLDLQAA